MPEFLLIRLEAPLQAWGDVAYDTVRPTRRFPSRSALAGLFASAMGWTYADGVRTTMLLDSLWIAVRADREGELVTDFQTAELASTTSGWTRWGIEHREIANVTRLVAVRGRPPRPSATQILRKSYLADASFLAAVGLHDDPPVTLDTLEAAVGRPVRPIFLGRRACLPSRPLFEGRVFSDTPVAALAHGLERRVPCWYTRGEGPDDYMAQTDVWDRRDFVNNRFEGARTVVYSAVGPSEGQGGGGDG